MLWLLAVSMAFASLTDSTPEIEVTTSVGTFPRQTVRRACDAEVAFLGTVLERQQLFMKRVGVVTKVTFSVSHPLTDSTLAVEHVYQLGGEIDGVEVISPVTPFQSGVITFVALNRTKEATATVDVGHPTVVAVATITPGDLPTPSYLKTAFEQECASIFNDE